MELEEEFINSFFYDYFIISDIRFPVEMEKVKAVYPNSVAVKMLRESDELNEKQKASRTETALDSYDKFDYVIDNNGTLEELKEKALQILQETGE